MTYYNTQYGGRFNTYEEAADACLCDQSMEDFEGYFSFEVSYTKLLNWAMKQEKFYYDFCNEIEKANQEYLDDFITEEEDEDD